MPCRRSFALGGGRRRRLKRLERRRGSAAAARYNAGVFAAFIAMSFTAAAQAPLPLAGIGRQRVKCPVCGRTFEAFDVVEENTAGGVDRDLFARAIGPQPEFYRISTCPSCLYSGYLTDFTAGGLVPPFVVERILRDHALPRPAGVTSESDPREIDARDRYALAIRCYEWRQRSDESLAWLHLRASWVVRDTASVAPRTPRLERVLALAQRWHPPRRPGANQADDELEIVTRAAAGLAEGQFNRYQEPFVRFFVAMLLRKQGENRQAAPLLAALKDDVLLEEPLREAARKMVESIAAEQEHQRAAAARFQQAILSERIAEPNRAVALYLTGELCRRLGRDAEAIRWFDRALASGKLSPELLRWTRQQRAWAQAGVE